MPLSIFREKFYPLVKDHFKSRSNRDAAGRSSSDLQLLTLGVLQVLGRHVQFQQLYLTTYIHGETHRLFFHDFVKFGREVLYPMFVKMPETEEQLKLMTAPYTQYGLPGCIGSGVF